MARRQRAEPPLASAQEQGVHTIRRGETSIAYRILGSSGPMVLLLQPFWVGVDDVRADLSTFGPHLTGGHRVIVHDRRGTGFSDRRPGQVSVKVQAEDIGAILDEIGVRRVMVVALSEAAPLAVHVAVAYPDRVARLVLVDPHLRPRVGPGSTMLLHTLHSRPRVGLKAFARSLVGDDDAADELATRMNARMDAPTAARLYEAFLQADALSIAANVPAHTLLAFGVHDRLVVEDDARDLQGRFPTARIGLVQGTPGTSDAVREAWVEMQDFLALRDTAEPAPDTAPPKLRPIPLAVPRDAETSFSDYVPSGVPPSIGSLRPAFPTSPIQQPVYVRWGPPAHIPEEAIALNRKAVDHILLGEIEEALTVFQRATEIAPEYEDAQMNYRELLSRLVQRRVAQWQTEQAEMMIAQTGRQTPGQTPAPAKRARKFSLVRLFRSGETAA